MPMSETVKSETAPNLSEKSSKHLSGSHAKFVKGNWLVGDLIVSDDVTVLRTVAGDEIKVNHGDKALKDLSTDNLLRWWINNSVSRKITWKRDFIEIVMKILQLQAPQSVTHAQIKSKLKEIKCSVDDYEEKAPLLLVEFLVHDHVTVKEGKTPSFTWHQEPVKELSVSEKLWILLTDDPEKSPREKSKLRSEIKQKMPLSGLNRVLAWLCGIESDVFDVSQDFIDLVRELTDTQRELLTYEFQKKALTSPSVIPARLLEGFIFLNNKLAFIVECCNQNSKKSNGLNWLTDLISNAKHNERIPLKSTLLGQTEEEMRDHLLEILQTLEEAQLLDESKVQIAVIQGLAARKGELNEAVTEICAPIFANSSIFSRGFSSSDLACVGIKILLNGKKPDLEARFEKIILKSKDEVIESVLDEWFSKLELDQILLLCGKYPSIAQVMQSDTDLANQIVKSLFEKIKSISKISALVELVAAIPSSLESRLLPAINKRKNELAQNNKKLAEFLGMERGQEIRRLESELQDARDGGQTLKKKIEELTDEIEVILKPKILELDRANTNLRHANSSQNLASIERQKIEALVNFVETLKFVPRGFDLLFRGIAPLDEVMSQWVAILQSQHISLIGQPGDVTQFDANLHRIIGERNSDSVLILESGYLLEKDGESYVLSKAAVRDK